MMLRCANALVMVLFSELPLASGIELKGFNPTYFNFLSDLMGIVIQYAFGVCLAGCYGLFVNHHLKKHRTVPLETVGSIPDSMPSGLTQLLKAGWSSSFVFLFVLLAVNDLFHAIADLGLDFTTSAIEGSSESVFSLHTTNRNRDMPVEALGEPFSIRTDVLVSGSHDGLATDEDVGLVGEQTKQINSFMKAVDSVARATSPFLSSKSLSANNQRMNHLDDKRIYGGVDVSNIYHTGFSDGNSFLAGIDLYLPLNCSGKMTEINQTQGTLQKDYRNFSALVPSCAYNELRPNGIFASDVVERAEITTYLLHSMDSEFTNFSIVAGGRNHTRFLLPAKSRALPRDRLDHRSGRIVEEIIDIFTQFSMGRIDAIQIGSASIPIGAVVVGRGRPFGSENKPGLTTPEGCSTTISIDIHEYVFVTEIQECPLDPAGKEHESCIALLTAHCGEFPEDTLLNPDEIEDDNLQTSPLCTLTKLEILWGRNYDADLNLLVAVAGVYGRNQMSVRGISDGISLAFHLIPAALFMMSTITELPSDSEVIIPTINALYIFFMLLPFVLAGIALGVSWTIKHNDIVWPNEPWKLAVAANETAQFPHQRVDCHDEFPEEVAAYPFGIIGRDHDTERDIFGILLPGMKKGVPGHNNSSP